MSLYRILTLACCTALMACNQSDSHDLVADRLVLKATLYAQDQAVIKATLGKENSTVVVVLNGGDYLEASNGIYSQVLEYRENLINDVHYRAALPLDVNRAYTLTLNRASQRQLYTSVFPLIPDYFSITYPYDNQSFSLTGTPYLYLYWDSFLRSNEVLLRSDYDCHWAISPALTVEGGEARDNVENTRHSEISLTTTQRNARSVLVDWQQISSELKQEVLTNHPGHSASLQSCRVNLDIAARNNAKANSGLSEQSQLSTIREQSVNLSLNP